MIAVYCVVILLFCGVAITLFVTKMQKDKKRYKKLNEKKEIQLNGVSCDAQQSEPVTLNNAEAVQHLGAENKLNKETETENQTAQFENFSLEKAHAEEKGNMRKQHRENPFDFEDVEEDEDDKFAEYERFLRQNLVLEDEEQSKQGDDFEEINESFRLDASENEKEEESFEEYEKFLRRNLDLETDETDEDALRAVRNFDYNSIKGKSESEIRQIIKNLPPKAQEILLTDILARKNWDEE